MTAEIADASLSATTDASHVIVELSCAASSTTPTDTLLGNAIDAGFTATNGGTATTLSLDLSGCGAVSATDNSWVSNLATNSVLTTLYFIP